MDINWIQVLSSVIIALISSTGLWSFISKKREKNDASRQMLLGLGHDRIIERGEHCIQKGYATPDEFENLYQYLFLPYKALGGNGSAERIMDAVRKLPNHKEE